jgi:hypothetical protein
MIILFGADLKANNMSTNDDRYVGACSLIEFRRLAVSNENAAESNVSHFRNPSSASLNDCLSQKAVDATESINGHSDRRHLVTASIKRYPLRDKSNDRLNPRAGSLTIEAVDALHSIFVVKKKWMKYKDTLGKYPP